MKFTKAFIKTKLKATAVHFSLSFVVFLILAYLVFYVWYPMPYFSIAGGWQGMRIIAAVDLVLGPLITFLIFDLSKSRREITFDLLTIVTIQIGALIYGVVTTYQQRPIAIVVMDRYVVAAIESDYGSKLESPEILKQYSPENPPIIYAEIPLNKDALEEITRIRVEHKIAEHSQMQLYQSHEVFVRRLNFLQQAHRLRLNKVAAKEDYEKWLAKNKMEADEVLVAPFIGRYGSSWLLFDKNGRYQDYILDREP